MAEESPNLRFLGSRLTLDLAAAASAERVKLDQRFCKLCVVFKNIEKSNFNGKFRFGVYAYMHTKTCVR